MRRDRELQARRRRWRTKWSNPRPTVWRFELRPNVKWHDGVAVHRRRRRVLAERAPSAGLEHAQATSPSFKEVRKVDDLTVEVETQYPDPVFADKLAQIAIMSKAWSEKNNATRSADLHQAAKRTSPPATHRHRPLHAQEPRARREDGARRRIPNWWDKPQHNLDEVEFSAIGNDATRVAALLSGEVDMLYTVPPQDVDRIGQTPGLKVVAGPGAAHVFLGFDQMRDELSGVERQGQEPVQGRARAPRLLPGDRRRGDQEPGDARPVGAGRA